MGGPSVKQFIQSPGIHVTPNVDYLKFDVDSPEARRRSVYRFLFRTLPDPFMDALDCPDASQFTPVRTASVTAPAGAGACSTTASWSARASTSPRGSRPSAEDRPAQVAPGLRAGPGPARRRKRRRRGSPSTRRARPGQRLPGAAQLQRVHVRGLRRSTATMNRREASGRLGGGLGGLALAHLLATDAARGPAAAGVQRRAAPPGQGPARHPALHERRRQPDGHVRLQAGADQAARPEVRPGRAASRSRRSRRCPAT